MRRIGRALAPVASLTRSSRANSRRLGANRSQVRHFLFEFFHPDHGLASTMHVVLVVPSEPTAVMREVLLDFPNQVRCLVGHLRAALPTPRNHRPVVASRAAPLLRSSHAHSRSLLRADHILAWRHPRTC